MSGTRPPQLRDAQRRASDPAAHAWVSASAGTGKTHVLTARVLRLLLGGAEPQSILCVTFTRAAAAEMQQRLFATLESWVHGDDAMLDAHLAALCGTVTPPLRDQARTLFARLLDVQGGVRIETLHGFAQSLLAAFPIEAGVQPGFGVLDDRTAVQLRRQLLADIIIAGERSGDAQLTSDLARISIARGDSKVDAILEAFIHAGPALLALAPETAVEARLRRAFGLPLDLTRAQHLERLVGDEAFPLADVRAYAARLASGDSKSARQGFDCMQAFVAASAPERIVLFDALARCLLTSDGNVRNPLKQLAGAEDLHARLAAHIQSVRETLRAHDLVAHMAPFTRVGLRMLAAYRARKRSMGLLDFGDMIEEAARLLGSDGAAAWVRYKLDARIDHVLVDEAQDTNDQQWRILDALVAEFFAQASERPRTLFAVGDFKQSIFSFQGAEPRVFEQRRGHYQALAAAGTWYDVDLDLSFRSTPPVLAVVDALVAAATPPRLGLEREVPRHIAHRADAPGEVQLWRPVSEPGDDGAGGYRPSASLVMARKLAEQISDWIAQRIVLPSRGRAVQAGDILVLVRKRGDFMHALVGALAARGIAVAGVDRLAIGEPLAVMDMLALMRFVLQPSDDLALATLMTSPLLALGQEDLFVLAHARGRDTKLWRRLRASSDARHAGARAWLDEALALADFVPPYEFLESILSGPLDGRARLLARLGEDARDAIDTLLAQAIEYERLNAPSLQGFLDWIERSATTLKRDPDAAGDAVRIMTVHGAKGLQAPIVVLADSCSDTERNRNDCVHADIDGVRVPVFAPAALHTGPVAQAAAHQAARDAEEDQRLLYVALTRAEDILCVGGALSKIASKAGAAPDSSWHARVAAALASLGAVREDHAIWGERLCHRNASFATADAATAHAAPASVPALPAWAAAPAPAEPAPPRPLSPSAIARDDIAAPPPSPALAAAARRGTLLHALFERLPAIEPGARHARALAWLAREAPDLDASTHAALVEQVLAVMAMPELAPLFAADALAEAPLAAEVDGRVIAGTVDRLALAPDGVWVADFKTGLAVPADAAAVPAYHLRQMAAYRAALQRIAPGRPVRALLVYTAGPSAIILPDAMLDCAWGQIVSGPQSA